MTSFTYNSKLVALSVFLLTWSLAVLCLYFDLEILVYPIVSLGLLYEVLTTKNRLKVFILVMIIGVVGWLFQSLESYMGTLIVMGYQPFAPPWLALLWALFMSSTLRTMPFVFNNIYLCFLFGCYALPGTYLFISGLGLAVIKEPKLNSLLFDALISANVFLITYFLLKFYFYKKGNLYV